MKIYPKWLLFAMLLGTSATHYGAYALVMQEEFMVSWMDALVGDDDSEEDEEDE